MAGFGLQIDEQGRLVLMILLQTMLKVIGGKKLDFFSNPVNVRVMSF